MHQSIHDVGDETIFTVDTLLKYMGNDAKGTAVVARIVRDGLASGNELLAVARQALRDGQHGAAARAFHGLRGAVGTLGTRRFVRAALAAELALAERRHDDVAGLLAAVEQEFTLVTAHACAWLARAAQ